MLVFLLLMLTAFLLLTLLGIGSDVTTALSLWLFGVRPTGLSQTLWSLFWYLGVLPAFVIGFVVTMCLLVIRRSREARAAHLRSARRAWTLSLPALIAGVVILGVPYLVFVFGILVPRLQAATHASTWPADLVLSGLQVCAMDVSVPAPGVEDAFGRIVFQITNTSATALREATFTLYTGQQHQFRVRDLAPQATGTVEVEDHLGNLACGRACHRLGARLYWDTVQFANGQDLKLAARPQTAQVSIGDCPRFNLIGTWRGTDGSEIRIKQVGDQVSGDLMGGPFSSFSSIAGTFDGVTLSGRLTSRSGPFLSTGTFTLVYGADQILRGSWSFTSGDRTGESGTWEFAHVP